MGSKGDAYDNSVAESFFSTLEKELLAENRFRMHSSIGNTSPSGYERMYYDKLSARELESVH